MVVLQLPQNGGLHLQDQRVPVVLLREQLTLRRIIYLQDRVPGEGTAMVQVVLMDAMAVRHLIIGFRRLLILILVRNDKLLRLLSHRITVNLRMRRLLLCLLVTLNRKILLLLLHAKIAELLSHLCGVEMRVDIRSAMLVVSVIAFQVILYCFHSVLSSVCLGYDISQIS